MLTLSKIFSWLIMHALISNTKGSVNSVLTIDRFLIFNIFSNLKQKLSPALHWYFSIPGKCQFLFVTLLESLLHSHLAGAMMGSCPFSDGFNNAISVSHLRGWAAIHLWLIL